MKHMSMKRWGVKSVTESGCHMSKSSEKKNNDRSHGWGERLESRDGGVARGDVCKFVMEDWPVERRDGLMKNTVDYNDSACAICFFFPSLQKATPY